MINIWNSKNPNVKMFAVLPAITITVINKKLRVTFSWLHLQFTLYDGNGFKRVNKGE